MRSLRRSMQIRLVAALVLLLGAGGLALFLFLRKILVAQFDSALEGKVRLLAAMVKVDSGGKLEAEFQEASMSEFERSESPEYFELRTSDGVLHTGSRSLRGARVANPPSGAGGPDLTVWDLGLPDGRAGRAVALRFVPSLEHPPHAGEPSPLSPLHRPLTLIAARERSSLDRLLGAVRLALFAIGALLVLAIPIAVFPLVRRGLRPLDEVADRAATIDARRLEIRFPAEGLPLELRPIAVRLNDLLERLSASFERERRFSADVAHELRTPLAELRTIAEVSLASADLGPDATAALLDVVTAVAQMERIVTTLLALARCETGRQPVHVETVDLQAAVADAWGPLDASAKAKRLDVTLPREGSLTIATDRALLGSMLANLLSNAVEYTPEGGRITCTVAQQNGTCDVNIENTQTALSHDDLAHLFDPFWRKDEARTGGVHAGLGLSLVSAFARLLNAEVEATLPGPGLVALRARFHARQAPRA